MSGSHNLSRRDFTKAVMTFVGAVMGAVVGIPVAGYLVSPAVKAQKTDAWVTIGPLDDYTAGQPALFSFTRAKVNGWEKTVNSYGVYVVRAEGDAVKVLSNACTHLGCRVTWQQDQNAYTCPCHDARFGRDGEVLSGPPPRALDGYETRVENGTLSIRLLE
ncbi:MAG: Rieske (2Fe-2S) protein [Chloroflexi bacterium]|nr:Rieske (2Fe-2S) protein [Chloroflexota bacterium]